MLSTVEASPVSSVIGLGAVSALPFSRGEGIISDAKNAEKKGKKRTAVPKFWTTVPIFMFSGVFSKCFYLPALVAIQ